MLQMMTEKYGEVEFCIIIIIIIILLFAVDLVLRWLRAQDALR